MILHQSRTACPFVSLTSAMPPTMMATDPFFKILFDHGKGSGKVKWEGNDPSHTPRQ